MLREEDQTPVAIAAKDEPATLSIQNTYHDIYTLKPAKTGDDIVMQYKIATFVPSRFANCGKIELDKIAVVYHATGPDQTITAGFCVQGSDQDMDSIGMGPSGMLVSYTDYTRGKTSTVEMEVPGMLSKVMRGPQTLGMPAEFRLQASNAMKVTLHVYYKLHGPEVRYASLKC